MHAHNQLRTTTTSISFTTFILVFITYDDNDAHPQVRDGGSRIPQSFQFTTFYNGYRQADAAVAAAAQRR